MKTLEQNASRVETSDRISAGPMRLRVRTPADCYEKDACVRHDAYCWRVGMVGESQFLCTRQQGHEGDHVAGAGSVVCVRWHQ